MQKSTATIAINLSWTCLNQNYTLSAKSPVKTIWQWYQAWYHNQLPITQAVVVIWCLSNGNCVGWQTINLSFLSGSSGAMLAALDINLSKYIKVVPKIGQGGKVQQQPKTTSTPNVQKTKTMWTLSDHFHLLLDQIGITPVNPYVCFSKRRFGSPQSVWAPKKSPPGGWRKKTHWHLSDI